MKKIIALLLACVMVLGLFAACGTAPDPTEPNGNEGNQGGNETPEVTEVTLKVWAPTEDHVDENSWLPQMLAKFEEAHPEYDITWELGVCGEGDAASLVGTDPSAAGDVFMFANDQIGGLVDAGALSKLGGSYEAFVKENFGETYINAVTYDGGIYGFPMTCNTWFMYYNKSVLSEEDVKSLETILEKGVVAFPMTTAWYNGAFFLGNGGTLFGEAGNDETAGIQFGGEAGYAAAAKMVELMANPNFVDDANGKGNAGLKDGSVVAYFNGSWEFTNAEGTGVYDVLGENLGAAALPTVNINGTDVSMKSLAGAKCVGVNRNSANPKVAMELAAFLASEEGQLLRFELRGITPALSSLAENEKVKASICAQAELAVMGGTSVVQPGLSGMSNFWSAMGTFGANVVNGTVNAENVQEQVDALMEALNAGGL